MAREKKNQLVTGLLILVLLATLLGLYEALDRFLNPDIDTFKWKRNPYKVMPGDTLWTIADKFKPENISKQEYIHYWRQETGVSPLLREGEVIEVFVLSE